LPRDAQAIMEKLDEAECLRLVADGVIGRIAYVGQYDLTVAHADYKVAFEVDRFDETAREGWSVLI